MDSIAPVASHRAVTRFAHDHLSSVHWEPSAHLSTLLQTLISPPMYEDWLHRLFLENRAIEIVTESLATFARADAASHPTGILSRQEHAILTRAEEFIASHILDDLTVASVHRNAGTSATVLQRLMSAKHGGSLFGYIRLKVSATKSPRLP
ncbi:hypothetical protein AB3G45_01025 [Shinella sp. S4-D37]|uniref:hypothetical protein n=1 Tax=Shinella sp. S4-D37 TaxID=3161999 RepID=UPI00346689BD